MVKLRNEWPSIKVFDASVAKSESKRADAHYRTPEHQAWRKQVMINAKWRCQSPGCKAPRVIGQRLFADHIVELQDDGAPFDPANGQALCGSCHQRKTIVARAERMAQHT